MSYFGTRVGGLTVGVVLEDPVRHHEIVDVHFDFWTNSKAVVRIQVPCFLQCGDSSDDDRDGGVDQEPDEGPGDAAPKQPGVKKPRDRQGPNNNNKRMADEENPNPQPVGVVAPGSMVVAAGGEASMQVRGHAPDLRRPPGRGNSSGSRGTRQASKFIAALEKYHNGRPGNPNNTSGAALSAPSRNPTKLVKPVIAQLMCNDVAGVLQNMSCALGRPAPCLCTILYPRRVFQAGRKAVVQLAPF
ncbi:hypothetical protein MAPG_10636 [Magnaporthiopsis poae ATCC 64411]|uniref:Uncharacterized protein n=1 Tax=Magnaporthiopsis poae (strain ATCC 64411 / 73-15) TaxID=644358 RepID=A0A0C4ED43_MAGP6|nr:hypothetical protein MAPG_10636 [Magnaporthiopsis poae ATCC 64411]